MMWVDNLSLLYKCLTLIEDLFCCGNYCMAIVDSISYGHISNQTMTLLFKFLADKCTMQHDFGQWHVVRQKSCGTFLKRWHCEPSVPFLHPFLISAKWDIVTMAGEQPFSQQLDHNLFLRENPGVQILYQAESPHKHCPAWLQTSVQKINELLCLFAHFTPLLFWISSKLCWTQS